MKKNTTTSDRSSHPNQKRFQSQQLLIVATVLLIVTAWVIGFFSRDTDLLDAAYAVIPGAVPNLINLPKGCTFADRCELREEHGLEICNQKVPDLKPINGENHTARCWLYQDDEQFKHKAPIKPSGLKTN